jgi:hypothetical protein
MRRQLPTLNLASPCHEPTENMRDVAGGRHCFACNKKVVDLTQMTADEAEALFIASGEDLCGEVRMKPSGVPAFRSKSLLAAGVAASLMASGCGSLPASPAQSTPSVSLVSQAKDEHIEQAAEEVEAPPVMMPVQYVPAQPAAPDQASVEDVAVENIPAEQPTELSDEDAGDEPDAGPQVPRSPIARGRISMHR